MLNRKVDMRLVWIAGAILFFGLIFLPYVHANESASFQGQGQRKLNLLIKSELSKIYGESKIEITGSVRWVRAPSGDVGSVTVLSDNGKGDVQFLAYGRDGRSDPSEGWASFMAMSPARLALRRIHPGEKLAEDMFVEQNVNVAIGQAHELRGVLLSKNVSAIGLEARQTILEGQMLTSTAVERVPDVRRGDTVRIHLISGSLILTTMGTAEEPAYLNSQVRVMTSKAKRELTGMLLPEGIVEVNL